MGEVIEEARAAAAEAVRPFDVCPEYAALAADAAIQVVLDALCGRGVDTPPPTR